MIILDIEGTIAPMTFVSDILFPYARTHIEEYFASNWDNAATQAAIQGLIALSEQDRASGALPDAVPLESQDKYASVEEFKAAVIRNVDWLMALDRKVTPLKALQGLIWENGFTSGEIKGQIYEDAKNAMERWVKQGKRLYIYSSGSVAAQKLVFKYSQHGDMSSLISGYFDTNIGGKREAASYSRILEAVHSQANKTLFLTDIVQEHDAAVAAGMDCIVVDRGQDPKPNTISTFDVLRAD